MKIVRMKLTSDDFSNPGIRWNADCDCIQITVDGGDTWTNDDGADPRTNPAYLLPPNTESDVKCAAAGGMVYYVRSVVDAAIDGTSAAGIANAILAIGLAFLPIAPFFALIYAVVDALLVITGAVLDANFTPTVYDQLLCIFYCHVDAGGRLDAGAMEAVLEDCSSIIGNFTVQTVMELLVQLVGFVGFSNTGAKNADPEADCSACECCESVLYDFLTGTQMFVPGAAGGDYHGCEQVNGVGWASILDHTCYGGALYCGDDQVRISRDYDNFTPTHFEIITDNLGGDAGYTLNVRVEVDIIRRSDNVNLYQYVHDYTQPPGDHTDEDDITTVIG